MRLFEFERDKKKRQVPQKLGTSSADAQRKKE
jgi:hypothetical protein